MQLIVARSFLIAAALAFFGCKSQTSTARAPGELSFALKDLAGKTVQTSDYRGQVVLVDFWATWCKPCETSFPFYSSLQQQLARDGFTILAISVDERDEDVTAFLARHPVSFRVLRDPEGSVARSIEQSIETMPTAVLIGRDGRVVMVHAGFVSGDEEMLTRAVKDALAVSTSTVASE